MLITDELREIQWYDMKGPLDSERRKLIDEYFALAVLRYCYPAKYCDFYKADGPDIQSNDGKSGVEVTRATDKTIASIEGNYANSRLCGNETKKQKYMKKCEKAGASFDSIGMTYPVQTGKQDEDAIRNVIKKKLKMLESYCKKGFERMELFIRFAGIPLFDNKQTFVDLLSAAHGYETVYFTAPSCLMAYRFSDGSFTSIKILREDYEALGLVARLTVDGKIKPDSPIWTEYKENQHADA